MVLFAFNCLIHLEFVHIPFLLLLCICLKKYMFAVENLENNIYREENHSSSQSYMVESTVATMACSVQLSVDLSIPLAEGACCAHCCFVSFPIHGCSVT